MAATPPSLMTARIIAASLIGGVTTFALVAWFAVHQRGLLADPAAAAPLLYAWGAVTFAAIAAAVILWRLRVAPHTGGRAAGDPSLADTHEQALKTALVLVWALMEAPALFGIVVFLLFGFTPAFAAGVLLVWLGIGLTFPRTAWFPSTSHR